MDIVDRLRTTPLYERNGEESNLGEEAADKIELLEHRCKILRKTLNYYISDEAGVDCVDEELANTALNEAE